VEQAWIAHRLGGEMPSLVPDRWGTCHTRQERITSLVGAIGD
jgi:hypothetical protein